MGIQKRVSLAISGLLFAGASALTLGAAAPAAAASTATVSAQSVNLPSWGNRGRRGHHRCFERFNCCCDDFGDDFDDFDDCDDFDDFDDFD
ncbi:hypothetical protein [Actinomadura alba]|uniref:Secreted protein n=1 Tax=Actinomadura alba TaxID=406431 RepID=A0ABR7LZH2_9ACTN|nr:hypothetical protein [Actinomadura alba]MBC6470242.1 hypothetical protein [Actinomadura alba]